MHDPVLRGQNWRVEFGSSQHVSGAVVKNPPADARDTGEAGSVLSQEDPLE